MKRFFFKKGMRCFRGEQVLTLLRRLVDKRLQFEAEDGEVWVIKEAELLDLIGRNDLRIDLEQVSESEALPLVIVSRDLSSYPEAHQDQAKRRLAYVRGLEERGIKTSSPSLLRKPLEEIACAIGDKTPPSPSSVHRWVTRFRNGASVLNLVNRTERSGRRRRWPQEVEAALDEAIDTVFLDKQRHPRKCVVDHVRTHLSSIGKESLIPSRASIYRWLKDLDAIDVAVARHGKLAGNRTFRSVTGIQRASRILERIEIDHTPLNLLVYCAKSNLPIGRPYLTIAIDKYSRLVVGYYISFSNPSAYSVLQCLKQSFLPKDYLLTPFPDITAPWPARGIPLTIVCDNGMELHSNALSEACLELGIQLQFCPAKRPEYKGSVERFFRTINHNLIHYLPGTVFSSPKERGDYESEKLAAISFETLNHLVLKWITEVYHQTPHRGIGLETPLKRWQEDEQNVRMEYPAEPAQLDVILGHSAERPVFHYGVEINNLRYNSAELQQLRRAYGEDLRVSLKFQRDDLGKIYVFDTARKDYFSVPAIDQEYASGLTMDMHELIKTKGRYKASDNQAMLQLCQKKKQIQEIVEKAVHDKKMANRKRASALRTKEAASHAKEEGWGQQLSQLISPDPAIPLPKMAVRARRHSSTGEDDAKA